MYWGAEMLRAIRNDQAGPMVVNLAQIAREASDNTVVVGRGSQATLYLNTPRCGRAKTLMLLLRAASFCMSLSTLAFRGLPNECPSLRRPCVIDLFCPCLARLDQGTLTRGAAQTPSNDFKASCGAQGVAAGEDPRQGPGLHEWDFSRRRPHPAYAEPGA